MSEMTAEKMRNGMSSYGCRRLSDELTVLQKDMFEFEEKALRDGSSEGSIAP